MLGHEFYLNSNIINQIFSMFTFMRSKFTNSLHFLKNGETDSNVFISVLYLKTIIKEIFT